MIRNETELKKIKCGRKRWWLPNKDDTDVVLKKKNV